MFRVFYGLFSISVPDVTTSSNVHSQGHSVELEPAAICSSSPSISSQVLLNSWKIFSPLFNRGCVRSRTPLLFFSFCCLLYNFSFSAFASPPQFIFSQRGYMQILSQENKICRYRYKNLVFAFTALCIFKMYGSCLNLSSVLQNQRNFHWEIFSSQEIWLEVMMYFASCLCVSTLVRSCSVLQVVMLGA